MIEAYNLLPGAQRGVPAQSRRGQRRRAAGLPDRHPEDVHIQNLTELIELAEAEVSATSISSAAAAPASPTPWPRSWAMTPASERAPTPTTWPPSAPRSWSAAWASKTYSPLFLFSQAHSRRNFTVPAAVFYAPFCRPSLRIFKKFFRLSFLRPVILLII